MLSRNTNKATLQHYIKTENKQEISVIKRVVRINHKISEDDMFNIKRPFPKHFTIIICTQNIKEKTQQGHVCDEYIPVQAVETFVVASMFPI